jgi:putative oxidoreductase
MNILLWILQILMALLFLFAGATKFIFNLEEMAKQGPPNQIHFPTLFIYFIGVCELLGALGLILPGLFRIKTFLTPLAAVGLAIIMVGVVIVNIIGPGSQYALGPVVFLLMLLFIAYGRTKLAPIPSR